MNSGPEPPAGAKPPQTSEAQPDPVAARKERVESLRATAESLRAKLPTIQDAEILDAMQGKLQQVEEELAALAAEDVATTQAKEPVVPATPQQVEAADKLIAQARVERMRKNAARASELLKEAAAAAPTAPSVLEAVGDDYLQRGQNKAAQDMYAQAVKLDPTNVGLERKFAETVLRGSNALTIEQQLAIGLGGRIASDVDSVATAKAASLMTLFIPGSGHLVMGETKKGITIFVVWAAAVAWLVSDQHALKPVLHGTFTSDAYTRVLIPAIIAAVIHVGALMGCLSRLKGPSATPNRPNRPAPPVNLPFE